MIILFVFFNPAGMSEDSDYTSDINFPTQHQNNVSMHQLPRDHFRRRDDSRESQDFYPADEDYRGSLDRGLPSYEDDYYPGDRRLVDGHRGCGLCCILEMHVAYPNVDSKYSNKIVHDTDFIQQLNVIV